MPFDLVGLTAAAVDFLEAIDTGPGSRSRAGRGYGGPRFLSCTDRLGGLVSAYGFECSGGYTKCAEVQDPKHPGRATADGPATRVRYLR